MTARATAEDIRATALRILGEIVPEADLSKLDPAVNFREQLDIDSMDFLNFVIALHESLHIDVPETDYPKLASLNACVAYLTAAQHNRQP